MIKNLAYSLDIIFFFIFGINKNVIQIYNNKNIQFFRKNLVNIALKGYQNVDQPKKQYLILKMTISSLKSYFSLIFFTNIYLMIGTYKVELDKLLSLL